VLPGPPEPSSLGAAGPAGAGTPVLRSWRRVSRDWWRYRTDGSAWVFSLNSFQLIKPRMSGEDRSAVPYSVRKVWPPRRGTNLEPPTMRASKPGANGAIQYLPARWTALLISSSLPA
jgi:hypothetical protein